MRTVAWTPWRRSTVLYSSLLHVFPRLRCTTVTAGLTSTLTAMVCSSSGSVQKQSCWNCDHRFVCPVAFCPDCNKIQPQSFDSPFKLFGIEESFDIDLQLLTEMYRNMQKRLHPDLFAIKSEVEQKLSAQRSTEVNKAYQTLKDPIQRASLLLKMRGCPLVETDSISDPMFLGRVMELQEAAEECQDHAKLHQMRQEVVNELIDTQEKLSRCFLQDNLPAAKRMVQQMIYMNRVLSLICDQDQLNQPGE